MKTRTKLAFQTPNPCVKIRPIQADDLMNLLQLGLQREESLELTFKQMESHQSLAILVEAEGKVLAYGQMNFRAKQAEICNLRVLEAYRSKGIGTAMIQYLVNEGFHPPIELVEIGVELQNPRAYALYLALGFEEVYRLRIEGMDVIYLVLLKD